MSRSARGPRTLAATAGALAAAALLALGAGCGAGSGDGEQANTSPAAVAGPTGSTNANGAASSNSAGRGSAPGGEKARGTVGKPPQSGHRSAPAGGQAAEPRNSHSSDRRAAFHKVMKSCPARLPRAQCEALVKQATRSRHARSHPVEKPSDCLDAMSRAECEALLAADKAAAQTGASTDVEECLRNPTPECEKVLRAAFGAQIAAQEAGN